MENKAIEKAIQILGSRQKLADICGVSRPAVAKWLRGSVPGSICAMKIEDATNGQVTMRQIAKGVIDE